MTRRPNILWICADQMRFDTIHALGNPHINTPNLDRLVAQGTSFRRTYTQNPVCTPSRASFLTGRYPAAHRVYRNGVESFPPDEVLVTKLFAEAGYDCGLVGKLHLSTATRHEVRPDDGYRFYQWSHNPMTGEADAHNAYHHWLRDEKGVDPDALFDTQRGFIGAGVPEELHQTTWCAEMAARFIREPRTEPWLLSVNPYDPHPPFDPPQSYLDRYDPASLPPPLFRPSDLDRQPQFARVRSQTVTAANPLAEDTGQEDYASQSERGYRPPDSYDGRKVKAAYYAMVELIDTMVGQILDAVDASGQAQDTLVIFTSDHGELLGDHGLLYKGCRFFEGLTHVPLILSWPGHVRAGLRADGLAELVDLAPTILEAADLPVPDRMQGQSLLPIATGAAPPDRHKDLVICDFNDSVGYSPVPDRTQATMTFDGRWKLVLYHSHDIGELFDLQTDPGEFDNLFGKPEVAELQADLVLRHVNAWAATVTPRGRRVSNA
ncbi:sulfatase [Psychromarinibacter halotolerans]|uniref:Sulfatase n=1 Tax=Psychromarinibacter halotolerans TaxID=1775175 RepID=A0ABV7GW46_9RHOB|nr:sulfatase-like hydrolase/transferase [Psychromarinibacter halotolerans]MDF0595250.1 sulfatase-like hydrolase/transferase [Psychromarinibacter halotolerans]